jgi:hypothetical protein
LILWTPLAEALQKPYSKSLPVPAGQDHVRIKIDEGDDVTWTAATDEWLLAGQARVHGISRPLGPITMIIAPTHY